MADRSFSLTLRSISVVVLAFFIWTFGGVFDFAYAIKDSEKLLVNSEKYAATNSNQKSKQLSAFSRQSSAQQPESQKPEAQFEKTLEDIGNILADSTADLNTKKSKLKTKKNEIENLDIDIKKQFVATEKKLKEAGLSPEILQRHYDFVNKYDGNLKELKTDLDNIDKAKDKAEADARIEETKKFLDKVKPPKRHKPLDPNKLPHRSPEIKNYEVVERPSKTGSVSSELMKEVMSYAPGEPIQVAAIGSLDGLITRTSAVSSPTIQTSPTEADLAETIEVQFTPEIRGKAAELGNNPVKIYEWVRNTFDYEPYYGSLKGAQQTLLELAGNDFDQASLLIALLRAANIPARYVYGTIELPMDRLQNWIGGIQNPNTAAQILATNGIPGTLISEGGQIKYAQFEHVWVEAYVDMYPSMGAVNKQGKYWTPIDPSMKETTSSESIDISKVVSFDETAYLNSADDGPPILSYIYQIVNFYKANFDYQFQKAFRVVLKEQQEFGILLGTLPFGIITSQRYAEIPDVHRHRIALDLSMSNLYGAGDSFGIQKNLAEVSGKKITISYSPATADDQSIITSYGGLLSTPAYLINVKPEIRINDEVVSTGPTVPLGFTMTSTTSFMSPNMSTDVRTADLTHGISLAVAIPTLTYSGTQLVDQIAAIGLLPGALHDSINVLDSRAGELLLNIAISYFRQIDLDSKALESIMHVHNIKMPSVAFVSADAYYNEIFGMPISAPIMKGLSIDAIRVASSPMPIDGDLELRKEFIKHRGLNASYLEHKTLENLLGTESISAVKALKLAYNSQIPVYTLNADNIESVLPALTVSSDDKTEIRNAVNAGKEVITSRDNVTLYDWTGLGYIIRDPSTGSAAYMISSSLGGGATVRPTNPAFDKEQKMAYFIAGRAMPFINPGWGYVINDTVAEIILMPKWYHFGYTPDTITENTADKYNVLRAAIDKNTWVFYYIGHGGSDESGDYILPKPGFIITDPGDELRAQPIKDEKKADAKIVFLNGCDAGKRGDFIDAFKINGSHNVEGVDIPRPEVFISWTASENAVAMAYFALNFWYFIGAPTASEAIDAAKLPYVTEPDFVINFDHLRVAGDASLVP